MDVTIPPADRTVVRPGGRRVAFDDRGAADGDVVVFFHGTPDTRLARHPDDTIAADLGLRIIAIDRPGLGDSDPDADAAPDSVADDLVAVLDEIGCDRAHLLGWSAGAVFATATAGLHPDRVVSLTLVAPLVPADGYDDPSVLDGSGDSRRLFAEVFPTMSPDETGRELAMWLVPPVIDEETAREVLVDAIAGVAAVPGADAMLVAALAGTVRAGMTGLEREIAAQATRLDATLDAIDAPVAIHVGTADVVTPSAMADWFARRLGATVTVHDGATHSLGITGWAEILGALPR